MSAEKQRQKAFLEIYSIFIQTEVDHIPELHVIMTFEVSCDKLQEHELQPNYKTKRFKTIITDIKFSH